MEYLALVVVLILIAIPASIALKQFIGGYSGISSIKKLEQYQESLNSDYFPTLVPLEYLVNTEYKLNTLEASEVSLGSRKAITLVDSLNNGFILLSHVSTLLFYKRGVLKVITNGNDYFIVSSLFHVKYYNKDTLLATQYIGPLSTLRIFTKRLYSFPVILSSRKKLRFIMRLKVERGDRYEIRDSTHSDREINVVIHEEISGEDTVEFAIGESLTVTMLQSALDEEIKQILLLSILQTTVLSRSVLQKQYY